MDTFNRLLKGFVDLVYGTQRVKRRYERDNPTEHVLAAGASKSIMTTASQDVQRGYEWVKSRRAVLLLTNQNLVCGKLVIPLDSITTAQMLEIDSLIGGGQVLKIQTMEGQNYQFGMQANPEWNTQQRLPLTFVKGRVKHSAFSVIVRLLAVGYLMYWLFVRFSIL